MFFNQQRVVRAIACFFLFETVATLAAPSICWAASGPMQPEFASYASAGATDMVRLSTGDFNYNLPVLDIPGPERSFSLPLGYNSGIQLEQEASWVGLGWTLNAGAITRTVNGYPDDANNEPSKLYFNKLIQKGTSYAVIPGIWNQNWNSNTGSSGSLDLLGIASLNWDRNGITGGDVIGMGFGDKETSGLRMAMAVVTIATWGAAGAANLGANIGIGIASTVAISSGMGVMSNGRLAGVSGFNNKPSLWIYKDYPETVYEQKVKANTVERRFGSLYFGKLSQSLGQANTGPFIATGSNSYQAPQFAAQRDCNDYSGLTSTETAADIYQYGSLEEDGADGYYGSSRRPVSIAHDYYSVMGGTVSGMIRPQRLDVGSVAYPKLGRDECGKHLKYMVVPYLNDYKVPFRYEGSLSNTYDYHQYTPTANHNPTGIDADAGKSYLTLTDPRFDVNARIGPPRKGLSNSSATNAQFVQGKHTVWYSNREIEQMAVGIANGYPNGFLNFATPVVRFGIGGTNDVFRHQLPPDGIGAFAVTDESGTTYHYSLPVYQFRTFSESNERYPYAPNGSERGMSSVTEYSNNPGVASPNPHGGYATTWLLTAVTSPDYIDRNNSGTVDAGDWGGWVKLSYGKFSSHYKWRQPYIGNSYSDTEEPIKYEGHTEGYRESYYLDRIATRTHTALFVKSVRKDARGHFTAIQPRPSSSALDIDDTWPASSLRLDEIILLDNASLAKVETQNGIRGASDPNPTPAFSNDTNQDGGTEGAWGDALSRVLDSGDLTIDGRIKAFIEASAVKRIHFNYGYDLCRGVPNSFDYNYGSLAAYPPMDDAHASANRQGKLTLKSVSFFGPTVAGIPTKIIPDFTFSYESANESVAETNPAYGKEKWDAFGMYCASGAYNTTSHKPLNYGAVAPWTLRKIISPLGGVNEIAYERDKYARVSEFGSKKVEFEISNGKILTITAAGRRNFNGNLTDVIHANDYIELSGRLGFMCYDANTDPIPTYADYKRERRRVASVTTTAITLYDVFSLECAYYSPDTDPNGFLTTELIDNVVGGDVRVASIITSDGESSQSYRINYSYTDGTNLPSNSSGAIAKQPAFLNKTAHSFDGYFDYPNTPVLYSRVDVTHGQFHNANDYTSREVYEFFTPSSKMVSETRNEDWKGGFLNPDGSGQRNYQAEFYNNQVTIKTGLIGQPKAVSVYNARGQQELATTFEYNNNIRNPDGISGQGHYTEGTMTNEELDLGFFRTNRTTKEYIPSVMVGSSSTRNGVSITNRNELFDFYTGQVLSTGFTNSQGVVYHSITVPAYSLPDYASMGAKGDAITNSHMLTQAAAAYTVVEQPGNSGYNVADPLNPRSASVLSASVKTWKKDWNNYRVATTNGRYQDDAATQQPVWREQASYVWQSSLLKPNGAFASFVNYNWNGTPDSHWVKAGEALRYDHYSHALEHKDVNGLFAATKTGHDGTQELASAANARYTELAYSGAEDVPVDQNGLKHFGGEVVSTGTKADGLQATPVAHTGLYSIKLSAGQNMRYQAVVGSEVTADKPYRLNAWVNGGDLLTNAGRLYASVNGTMLGETSITAATARKAGNWYRLDLKVSVPAAYAGQVVEFGCRNSVLTPSAIQVYFDDFRVCPLSASMESKVYDPRTNQLTHSLDNENLFTRYEYNTAGRPTRIYKETFDRPNDTSPNPKLVKEYAYNYRQLYMPTWISDQYACATDADGNFYGLERRHVVDVNPLNNPSTPSKWEDNGQSASCVRPACQMRDYDGDGHWTAVRRLRGNYCEEAIRGQPDCAPRTGSSGGYDITIIWTYPNSNGDTETENYSSPFGCAIQRGAKKANPKPLKPARPLSSTIRTK